MAIHWTDEEADAMPAETPRPFYQPSMGKVLVHAEKSGPAFDQPILAPLATALAHSLQAQTIAAAGDVMLALSRQVPTDLMAAWPRLMRAMRWDGPKALVLPDLWDRTFVWTDTLREVATAMSRAEGPTRWLNADTAVRALIACEAAKLERAANQMAREAYANEREDDMDSIVAIRSVRDCAAAMRAWLEAR